MEEVSTRTDRARIHESVREIYEQLSQKTESEQHPFSSLKDVFVIAACLGYNNNRRKKFPSGKVASTIRSEVFTDKDRSLLKAIALAATDDINVLEKKSDEAISPEVLTIAEEYAHGGIEEIRNLVVEQPGYNLWNLVELNVLSDSKRL